MTFTIFFPQGAEEAPSSSSSSKVPVLYYLSGLTCTDENVMQKGGAQKACAKHGIAFVAPDTSPRRECFCLLVQYSIPLATCLGTACPWHLHESTTGSSRESGRGEESRGRGGNKGKEGAQKACAKHGIAFVAPDTSPR